jgi:hypothetical protein
MPASSLKGGKVRSISGLVHCKSQPEAEVEAA